jgi:hypothetical protein
VVTGSKPNSDTSKNVRHKNNRHLRNKKREYWKGKINGLETDSKDRNTGDLYNSEFKNGSKS